MASLAGCDTDNKRTAAQSAAATRPSTSAPPTASGSSAAPASPSSAISSPASASATAAGAPSSTLRKVGEVTVPQASTGLVLAAEGPDGTVFATVPGGNVVWTVRRGIQPAIAEHVSGGSDALAADATYLYVASGTAVFAYSRSTGELARQWALPSAKGAVLKMGLTGTRLWIGLGIQESDPPPDAKLTLVELNIAGGDPLRQLAVPWTTEIAGGPAGLYYVQSSSKLVMLSDAGKADSAPINDPVNLELSGPNAIQVLGVDGGRVLVAHYAGQGLDAVVHTYDTATLAGPNELTPYSADTSLAVGDGTLLALSGEGDCGTGNACLTTLTLGKGFGSSPIGVPPGLLLGPQPVVVATTGGRLAVSWFAQ